MPEREPTPHQTGSGQECRIEAVLVNKRGLHARASAKLCATASRFKADIRIMHENDTAGACSIMGLLMLGASCGRTLQIMASGPEARQALNALAMLIASGFGEDDSNDSNIQR